MPEERDRDPVLLIEREMKDSYLTYAMSVIVSRALPDVRDGLKPSQRRVLVAMNDLNLGPRSKFRKCAKIVGDTTGNYHPHGDQVVYPTLVRMAQDFNMRYCLVNGQGNFGSIDGDPPAAQRYTEARMTGPAMMMMADIDRDTVDFVPNFEETRNEPTVLPSSFPNLLCNGSTGIAVGMATSIPPHNLTEVVTALIQLLENPEITIPELMEILPGPDFPTGAEICGRSGIAEAYQTGRGLIPVRSKVEVEEVKNDRDRLVVTEIPYQVSKTKIIEKIVEVVKDGRVTGISDVRDESDKDGMRLVIDLKRGEEAQVVLNQLYQYTNLQTTFSIIMIALVENRPVTLNLKQLLEAFRDHRIEVIRRRTQFELDKAEKRAHILEGLRIALDHIDEVIAIIRAAPDTQAAQHNLCERFQFSEAQADAILQMRLQRLTGLERDKLEQEYRELIEKIEYYRSVLASRDLVLQIIREELEKLRDQYGDARRTVISGELELFVREDLIPDEPMAVTASHQGYIKALPLDAYRVQGRGGKGVSATGLKEGDFVEHVFTASAHEYILFFTNRGKVHWLKVYDLPRGSRTSQGRAIVNLLQLAEDELVTSMIPVREFTEDFELVFATENGIVKKTNLAAYGNPKKGGIIALSLDDDDRLIGVRLVKEGEDVMLGTATGYAIRFPHTDIRSMGRTARGVGGIALRDGDRVVSLMTADEAADVLTICEHGFGKRTPVSDYRSQRRNGMGLIDIKTTERNGRVVGQLPVTGEEEVMIVTQVGMIVRIPVSGISTIGRNTQGVRLIRVDEGDRVVSVAKVFGAKEEEEVAGLSDEMGEGPAPQSPESVGDEPDAGEAPESGDDDSSSDGDES
ncbi:MAG: DNA gyrase subunit A [Planctomycetota bacterium]